MITITMKTTNKDQTTIQISEIKPRIKTKPGRKCRMIREGDHDR